MSGASTAWRLAFEISPIILTRGIATLTGGYMPIVALTEPFNFVSILAGAGSLSLDSLLFHWQVLEGTNLIKYTPGQYPFFNQVMAANAVIKESLQISFMVACPVQNEGGMWTKLATFQALKSALDYHIQNGGTFTLNTPSYTYTDCLLTDVISIPMDGDQIQAGWQFNFIQPLITDPTGTTKNTLMQKLSTGVPIPEDKITWSGLL